MIPRIEHIGQALQLSWPKRARRWLNDLFGSKYAQLLERDLMQARLERDRVQMELKAAQERLVEVLATLKGIPLRPIISPQSSTTTPKTTAIPQTSWQRIQADAIAENARLEAEDAEKNKSVAQEN